MFISVVISGRIREEVKRILEESGVNITEEVRKYLEELAWRVKTRKFMRSEMYLLRTSSLLTAPRPEGRSFHLRGDTKQVEIAGRFNLKAVMV